MKQIKNLTPIAFVVVMSFFMSCSDDDSDMSTVDTNAITEEETVEIIEASMQESTGGTAETLSSYSEELVTETSVNGTCDETNQETIPFSFDGPLIQAEYSFMWSFVMTCNNLNIPQSATLSYTASGTYNTPRVSSTDSSSGQLTTSGLQPTASSLIYNGSLERQGTQTVTTNMVEKNITSTIEADLTNVSVSKSSYQIESGSGIVEVSGTNNGESFSSMASIVFNGDQTATVTINGNEYTIELD